MDRQKKNELVIISLMFLVAIIFVAYFVITGSW